MFARVARPRFAQPTAAFLPGAYRCFYTFVLWNLYDLAGLFPLTEPTVIEGAGTNRKNIAWASLQVFVCVCVLAQI